MMKKYLLAILVLLTCSPLLRALTPDGTFMFARRDTCDLYLDIYRPAEGAVTTLDGKEKPALLPGSRRSWTRAIPSSPSITGSASRESGCASTPST